MNRKCLVLFVIGIALLAAKADSQDTDMFIGERTWPPVSNGVLFVDGRYIPPPYTISRREGSIFVNKHHVDWTIQWPPKKKTLPPPPPKEMPSMPSTITENTTPYDKDYIMYVSYSRQYLISKHGERAGNEMMIDVYKGLPCVKEAKLDPQKLGRIVLTWINGEQYNISPPPLVGELNISKEQAVTFIDKIAGFFVKGLSNGDYYMVEGGISSRTGLRDGARGTFLPLADAMRAAKNEAEYLAIMATNQPYGGMSDRTLRSFYKYKDELPKWEPRLRDATGKK